MSKTSGSSHGLCGIGSLQGVAGGRELLDGLVMGSWQGVLTPWKVWVDDLLEASLAPSP